MIQNILLVEDDSQNRFVYCNLLKNRGYRVAEAKDGAEAVEMSPLGLYGLDNPKIQMLLVDFRNSNVDAAIRYGRGQWPGLRSDWLMAEDLFPVCSPELLKGERALRQPEDLARTTLLHTSVTREDWR